MGGLASRPGPTIRSPISGAQGAIRVCVLTRGRGRSPYSSVKRRKHDESHLEGRRTDGPSASGLPLRPHPRERPYGVARAVP